MGAAQPEPQSNSYALDGEAYKYVAELVLEAGISPLLHRSVVVTIVNEGVIEGVIVESKSGR
ncbi:MAG: hypothetical protein OSB45_05155 [Pseudomonadales bacterium]|jgi:hypothetical protein|nr:hypothetical protein [Pseudomonadales bacterium]